MVIYDVYLMLTHYSLGESAVIFKHTLQTDVMTIYWEIALMWMPPNTFDDKSTLVQAMAWCHWNWLKFLWSLFLKFIDRVSISSDNGLAMKRRVNTNSWQNSQHFEYNIFKCTPRKKKNGSLSMTVSHWVPQRGKLFLCSGLFLVHKGTIYLCGAFDVMIWALVSNNYTAFIIMHCYLYRLSRTSFINRVYLG